MADVQTFIPEVINAHFDEAAYLYSEFQVELSASKLKPKYLKSVISRIEANLDGLVINSSAASEYCDGAISEDDAGEFFVISYLAFQSGDLKKIKPVVEAAQVSSPLLQAVAYGLAWHSWGLCGFWATKFIAAKQVSMAAIGLFCFNIHKKPFPISLADLLTRSLASNNPVELPLLLSIGRKNGDSSIIPILQQNTSGQADGTKFQLLSTSISLGDPSALAQIKPFVLTENDLREQALDLAFSQLEINEAKQWMSELKDTPESERYLLLAVGAMNEKPLLPWVVKQMKITKLARVAGKVFSQLTGLDLRENGWIITNDSLDEQWLALDGDEELDWPDVHKIEQATKQIIN